MKPFFPPSNDHKGLPYCANHVTYDHTYILNTWLNHIATHVILVTILT